MSQLFGANAVPLSMVGTRVVRNAVLFGVCMSDFPDAPWNSRRDLCDALNPALTELAGR